MSKNTFIGITVACFALLFVLVCMESAWRGEEIKDLKKEIEVLRGE